MEAIRVISCQEFTLARALGTLLQQMSSRRVPVMWRSTLEDWAWAWPQSLLQRLPWGPQGHFGVLGA